MTTVAITGVAGHVGRRLVHALDLRGDVERIVGIDVVAPRRSRSSKLTYRQLDVRDASLIAALRDVDVVVHLAARTPRPRDVEVARSVTVDGARNVVAASRAAGVRQLVHGSSVFVYGAHPDNDLPLTEASALRPTGGLHVGQHQRDAEAHLAPLATPAPAGSREDLAAVVLRFAMILGPDIDNVVTRLLESPRLVAVRGHRPPLQFLHVDDAVRAIVHAIEQQLSGTYNVCAEGWLSFDEVTAIARRRALDVPDEVAHSAAEQLWQLGLGEHPPGIVDHLMHPWVMTPDALMATGWRPTASNRDALAETVQEHGAYVSLAGARAERRVLARVGLAGVGIWAALLAGRRWWRRRRAARQP